MWVVMDIKKINKQRGQKLVAAIHQYFKNISRTRYWIRLNYYAPTDGYNFFFEQARPRTLSRSQPIGDFPNLSFEDLIEMLVVLRQKYHFTIRTSNLSKEHCMLLRRQGVL